jgi:hypothetical protein
MDRFEENGAHLTREGVAKSRGMRNLCKKKLCLVSTDKQFLLDLMVELSAANDCFEVKVRREEREGVHLATCYFTNESALGDAWAQYHEHPKVWALVHDDELSSAYKSRIRSYTN